MAANRRNKDIERILTRLLAAAPLAGMFVSSSYACLPSGALPPTVYVGDKAHDSRCDYAFADIETALNASTCPLVVVVTGPGYNNLHLSIHGRSVTLVGSKAGQCGVPPAACDFAHGCGDSTPPAQLSFSGSGGSGSVIHIDGDSHVAMQNFGISNGAQDSDHGYGGGVDFNGSGTLTLQNVFVHANSAAYGGGVSMRSNASGGTLIINSNSLIFGNTANRSGGGIFVGDSSHLIVIGKNLSIAANQAIGEHGEGYGGGIAVAGLNSFADVGGTGYSGLALIQSNVAINGGGIAAIGSGTTSAGSQVHVFALADQDQPTVIATNLATSNGGGIYVNGRGSGTTLAKVCIAGTRIDSNQSDDGAAIWANDGTANWNGLTCGAVPDGFADPQSAFYLCGDCNAITYNRATGTAANSIGAIVTSHFDVPMTDLIVSHNQGSTLFHSLVLTLRHLLIVDNTVRDALIYNFDSLAIYQSTIANNAISDAKILQNYFPDASQITLSLDIFNEPGSVLYDSNYATLMNVGNLISNSLTGIGTTGGNPSIVQVDDPKFVDPAHGNYQLLSWSPAVDFAPGFVSGEIFDLPVPNRFGPTDLGYYERRYYCAADTLFCAGFELTAAPGQ